MGDGVINNQKVEKGTVESVTTKNDTWLEKHIMRLWPSGLLGVFSGVLMFLLGLVINLVVQSKSVNLELVEACKDSSKLTNACLNSVVGYVNDVHVQSGLDWIQLVGTAFEALGLTVVAATVVAATVQHQSRKEHFNQMDRRISSMADNMMIGMFNKDHPPEVASALKELIWDRSLVRSELRLNYVLSRFEPDDPDENLDDKRFIKVGVMLSTKMRNVSTVEGRGGDVTVPLMLTVPNPMLNELKPAVKLVEYSYNGELVSNDVIKEANDKLQKQLEDDEVIDGVIKLGEKTLGSKQTATISASYTMIKELEDNEVFKTLQITEDMHAHVVDSTGYDLVIRAKSLSHGALIKQAGGTTELQWHMSELSIPTQGIMIWWKAKPKRKPKGRKSPRSSAPQSKQS